MNVADFLAELRSRDVRIWVDGERLRCDAPPGVLTPDLRQRLSTSKLALLDFLRNAQALGAQQRAIVPLQSQGWRPPLFAVPGHHGDVYGFRLLARCLAPEWPFYGLQPPGADGRGHPLERVEDLAAYFAEQIIAFRPDGPYLIAGYCAGGPIAFELARQLRRAGAEVGLLALIAASHPDVRRGMLKAYHQCRWQWQRLRKHAPTLLRPLAEQRRYLADILQERRSRGLEEQRRSEDPVLAQRARLEHATVAALVRYRPEPYPGPVQLFLPSQEWMDTNGLAARWRRCAGQLEAHFGPAGSGVDNILLEAHCPAFAQIFRRCLEKHVAPAAAQPGYGVAL